MDAKVVAGTTWWAYNRGSAEGYWTTDQQRLSTMEVAQTLDEIDENQKQGKNNVWPVQGKSSVFLLLVDSSEYKEGEAAFCRGSTTRDNPYSFRSPEYWRWEEGLLGNGRPREWQDNPQQKLPLPR